MSAKHAKPQPTTMWHLVSDSNLGNIYAKLTSVRSISNCAFNTYEFSLHMSIASKSA